jgi:hypothetical protein
LGGIKEFLSTLPRPRELVAFCYFRRKLDLAKRRKMAQPQLISISMGWLHVVLLGYLAWCEMKDYGLLPLVVMAAVGLA